MTRTNKVKISHSVMTTLKINDLNLMISINQEGINIIRKKGKIKYTLKIADWDNILTKFIEWENER